MSKTTMLGLDLGTDSMKWARMERGKVVQSDAVQLPENLVQDGRITSLDLMADQLKAAIGKTTRLWKPKCALVLPAESVIVRRLTMPYMTTEQLMVNLPYEFHDFIKDEKEHYFYDYAMIDVEKDEDGNPTGLDMLAAAVRRETIADYRTMLAKVGLKLDRAVPVCIAYGNLIRAYEAVTPVHPKEYCIVDMGHQAVRLYIYRGSVYETSRIIEYGGKMLDVLIADAHAVDPHLAAGYKRTNYNGAQEIPAAKELYNRVAVEITRAVNFYGFNTPNSELSDIYFTGGLANVSAMVEEINRNLNLTAHPIEDLMPSDVTGEAGRMASPAVVGILLQGDGR